MLCGGWGTEQNGYAKYHLFHGYGEGRGTDIEGWIDRAVSFWENITDTFYPLRTRVLSLH